LFEEDDRRFLPITLRKCGGQHYRLPRPIQIFP
jgi:hypothetical protein